MNDVRYPEIAKESLAGMHFPKGEVLHTKSEMQERQHNLLSALRLGNEFRTKVRITIMTEEGMREVITTIWDVSEDGVSLKSNIFVPLHSIVAVEHE
jgi:nitrogen regulatory protein PII